MIVIPDERYRWTLLEVVDQIHGLTTGSRSGELPFGDESLSEADLIDWLDYRLETWYPNHNGPTKMYDEAIKLLCYITVADWREHAGKG